MDAEIISIGTELLMGQTLNTNAQYISNKLSELGINVYYINVVGDNKSRIIGVIDTALKRSDIIIVSGGLGPTQDDLTKETISEFLNLKLILDEKSKNIIDAYFKKINKKVIDSNYKQAYFPEGSIILYNKNGTAPGCIIEKDNQAIILLPGPPSELKSMFEMSVIDYLKSKVDAVMNSRYIKVFGLGESKVEESIINLINTQINPTIATYANIGETTIRITSKSDSEEKNIKELDILQEKIKNEIGSYIYSYNGETFEEVVSKKLMEKNLTLSLAESCTGGMISSYLTDIPDISKVLLVSVVSYSNRAKINFLGVKKETIDQYGAVSEETAKEMAEGVKNISKSDIAVSITGIAGPGGGTQEKPVGLVYIYFIYKDIRKCYKLNLIGDRNKIRFSTKQYVLNIINTNL